MMRVSLGLALLLFSACKPMVRQPIASLTAISDGNLTLGVVPVENEGGTQAYRLLVCRRAANYPKWMLEDSNRCRHALVDDYNNEIVFLQDDMERDFATKYTGYGKGLVVPGIIAAATVAGGYFGGRWLIKQPFISTPLEHVKSFYDKATGKVKTLIPDRLKNIDLNLRWIETQRARYRQAFSKVQIKASAVGGRMTDNVTTNLLAATREQGAIAREAEELYHWKETRKMLTEMMKFTGNASDTTRYDNYVKKLTNRAIKLNGDKPLAYNTKGSLLQAVQTMKNDADAAFKAKTLDQEKIAAISKYLDNLPKYNEIRRIMYVTKLKNSLSIIGQSVESADKHILSSMKNLDELKNTRVYSAIGGIKLETMQRLKKPAALTGAGAAVFALQTMTDIDKSIWGYSNRQVSAYWSQVFREGGLDDPRGVADLQVILKALADTLGYRVNEAALALGN